MIQDYKATYSYKGVERQENFSAYFKNGNQFIGTSIHEYSSSDDNDYLLICSINNSDDIKLKSFSENVMLIPVPSASTNTSCCRSWSSIISFIVSTWILVVLGTAIGMPAGPGVVVCVLSTAYLWWTYYSLEPTTA